jgi:hypothetical protein
MWFVAFISAQTALQATPIPTLACDDNNVLMADAGLRCYSGDLAILHLLGCVISFIFVVLLPYFLQTRISRIRYVDRLEDEACIIRFGYFYGGFRPGWETFQVLNHLQLCVMINTLSLWLSTNPIALPASAICMTSTYILLVLIKRPFEVRWENFLEASLSALQVYGYVVSIPTLSEVLSDEALEWSMWVNLAAMCCCLAFFVFRLLHLVAELLGLVRAQREEPARSSSLRRVSLAVKAKPVVTDDPECLIPEASSVSAHFAPGARLRHWLHGDGFVVLAAQRRSALLLKRLSSRVKPEVMRRSSSVTVAPIDLDEYLVSFRDGLVSQWSSTVELQSDCRLVEKAPEGFAWTTVSKRPDLACVLKSKARVFHMWLGIGTVVTISEVSPLAHARVMVQLRLALWAATMQCSGHLPIESSFDMAKCKDLARRCWVVTFSRGSRGTIERSLEFHELLQLVLVDENCQPKAFGVAAATPDTGSEDGSESEAEAEALMSDSEDSPSPALTTDASAKETHLQVPRPELLGACLDLKTIVGNLEVEGLDEQPDDTTDHATGPPTPSRFCSRLSTLPALEASPPANPPD